MNDQDWDDYESLAAQEYIILEQHQNKQEKRSNTKGRKRKWREIDNIKENYRLQRELASMSAFSF